MLSDTYSTEQRLEDFLPEDNAILTDDPRSPYITLCWCVEDPDPLNPIYQSFLGPIKKNIANLGNGGRYVVSYISTIGKN